MADRGLYSVWAAAELKLSGECLELVRECLLDVWALKFRRRIILDRFMTANPDSNRDDIDGALLILRDAVVAEGPQALIDFRDALIDELKGDGEAN